MNIEKLTRLEALDLMSQIAQAAERQHWGTVIALSGLTDDMVRDLSIEEALEYASVRVADIARKAGLEIK